MNIETNYAHYMRFANSIFETKMNKQLKHDAFAILYRTNAQSRSMEEALRRLNIPYRIYGGLSFYNRKEVKDLLAYYRLTINHKDEEALKRVINYPTRGIGKTTMEKIIVVADQADCSLWDVIEQPAKFTLNLNSGTLNKISSFATMIKSFRAQVNTKNAFDLAKLIASSCGIMKDLYEDKTPEGISRYENIEELLNAIKEFSEKEREFLEGEIVKNDLPEFRTLDEFMQDIALITDADVQDKDATEKVSLMTIHAAKGLEFPYVYIVGMEENLFPSIQSLGSRSDLEEERRLFYVALTRAEKKVTISYSESRYRWGNLTICEPSRFIDEIDKQYLEFPKRAMVNKPKQDKSLPQKAFIPPNKKLKKLNKSQNVYGSEAIPFDESLIEKIIPGIEVEHNKFGKGKVIGVEGIGASKKAAIFFKNIGQKQLLLKYAKLKILDQ